MIAAPSDHDLIGLLLDGPADPGLERELARRIAIDPALGRLLRRHLLIAELAEQGVLPERGATAFTDGWTVRAAAEADAAVFTAGTMLRIAAEQAERRSGFFIAGLRAGSLAAAALLLVCLGWGGSRLLDAGQRWLLEATEVRLNDPAIAERGRLYRQLQEAQP
jgi:hypothetical protein